ncbi:increased DNA methylation [Salix suchowensis]|nr:increased DNA methylation [Salix suchowensis]
MTSSATDDFRGDGFEGSHREHCIFSDVFFGKDTGGTGATASGCFTERFTFVEGTNQNKTLKRIKFAVDGPLDTEPDTLKVLTSSLLPKEIVSGTASAVMDSPSQTVPLHLVESSSQGVISTSYLLKQHAKIDRQGDAREPDALKCSLPNADVVAGKAIASPVSQESYATRILLARPSVDVVGKSESPLNAEERAKAFNSPGLDVSIISKTDSKMDPRPFLQSHITRLLSALGWCIGKRKRPSRKYMESIYQSPEGRLFRDFPKVWRLCGQIFSANGYKVVHEGGGKEWADISHFWSDLSDTLTIIEKDMDKSDLAKALAHQWSILDPFVNVVFIERKVGVLRKGYMVKAAQSLVNDRIVKSEDSIGKEFAQKKMLAWHSDSCPVTKSASTICEGSCHDCDVQSGCRTFSECGQESMVKGQIDASIHMNDREGMCSDGIGNQSCSMCKDKIGGVGMTDWLTSGTDCTSAQLCSCQCNDFPVTAGNIIVHGVSESVSPHQDSNLVDPDDDTGHMDSIPHDEPTSVQAVTSGVWQQSRFSEEEGLQCIQASRFKLRDKAAIKKMRRKSRKISEIRSTTLSQSENIDVLGNLLESNKVEEKLIKRNKKSCMKSSPMGNCLHQVVTNGTKLKRMHGNSYGSKYKQKKTTGCQIDDDDLLIAAIIKNKDFSPGATRSISKKKSCILRAGTKRKQKKGGCRLLPRNLGKLGKHYVGGKWSRMGSRTVLSWLIDAGVLSFKDVVQYRNLKDDFVIKDGVVTKDGIMCKCCNMVLSVTKFKSHAGFKLSRPCSNLFMESGKPFTLCQLQAWSSEYKSRKSGTKLVCADEDDKNDDSCGLCGDGGELICCDNCPSTFHKSCLCTEELPEGSWYCPNCTCWICGDLVNDKEASSSVGAYKCLQCEHKYHRACQKGRQIYGLVSDTWFCSGSCQEVYSGLHSRVGINNPIADGFYWTLLRCIHEDQKVLSAQRLALKAECNSKLAVALTIMEECFQSMVDPRTGIDMIPHALYNWESDFARLNYFGFYTMVLEKDDVLVSAASVRVHGVTVAEMPLIATCSNYRRQGMCRHLMTAIEEMLISFKVEKLIISAIPDLVETWTKGFGFIPVSKDEKRSLNKINFMVFPGTILLKKQLFNTKEADAQSDLGHDTEEHITKLVQQSDENSYLYEVGISAELKHVESQNLQESEPSSERETQGNYYLDEVGIAAELKHIESQNLQESEPSNERETRDGAEGLGLAPPMVTNHSYEVGLFSDGMPFVESDRKFCSNKHAAKREDKNPIVAQTQVSSLQEQLSKLSCGDLVSALGGGPGEVACNVQSVSYVSSLDTPSQQVCEFNEK